VRFGLGLEPQRVIVPSMKRLFLLAPILCLSCGVFSDPNQKVIDQVIAQLGLKSGACKLSLMDNKPTPLSPKHITCAAISKDQMAAIDAVGGITKRLEGLPASVYKTEVGVDPSNLTQFLQPKTEQYVRTKSSFRSDDGKSDLYFIVLTYTYGRSIFEPLEHELMVTTEK
jgi:hypothetical protein